MSVPACPKCGSTKIENDECLHCGIFISKYQAFLRWKESGLVGGGPTPAGGMHVIDYRLLGDDMQYVEVELDPGEAAVAEAGSMMYMDAGIDMDTTLGDGSQSGVLGAVLGAAKRALASESIFMTIFTNQSHTKRRIAFASTTPGKIVPIRLSEIGGELIAHKDAFLAAAKGVSIGIAFQKRLTVGIFGGQGFIMERLTGDGLVFVSTGGALHERTLAPGETIRVETGSIVALQPTVEFDIEYVGRIKSALFGGHGLFFATLQGPGRIWLQSHTLDKLVARIAARIQPSVSGSPASPAATAGGILGSIFGTGGSSPPDSGGGSDSTDTSGGDSSSDSGSSGGGSSSSG
jgi:uncharacterized protein (TIGR00266 family)